MLFDLMSGKKHMCPNQLPTRQRCVNVRYKPILGSIKCYEQSFFPDVVKNWNRLPSNIANEINEIEFLKYIRALET